MKEEKQTQEQAIKVLANHWLKNTGKPIDDAILNHLDYVIDAMLEFSAAQSLRVAELELELQNERKRNELLRNDVCWLENKIESEFADFVTLKDKVTCYEKRLPELEKALKDVLQVAELHKLEKTVKFINNLLNK